LRSELVGLYFEGVTDGDALPLAEVSALMDAYGWEGGWRIEDDADGTIWNGGCPDCLFQDPPIVFIVETATMHIVELNPIGVEDILEIVTTIDEDTP
jgi:hypothetical protein